VSTGTAGRENALALASLKVAAEWMDGAAAQYSQNRPDSARPRVAGIAARVAAEEGLEPRDVPEVVERVLLHVWLELWRAEEAAGEERPGTAR